MAPLGSGSINIQNSLRGSHNRRSPGVCEFIERTCDLQHWRLPGRASYFAVDPPQPALWLPGSAVATDLARCDEQVEC